MNRPLGPCSATGRTDWRMGLQTLCFRGDGMARIACPSTELGAKFSLQGVLRVPRLWLCPFLVTALMLAANGPLWAQSSTGASTYLEPKQPIEVRVNDLLSRMTLKEKVGQLNLPCVYVDELGKTIPDKMNACRRFAAGTYTSEIGPGCGFFTLADTILHEGPKQQAEYFNELQKIALTQTRLNIPLLEDEEGTHGAMFPGATIFPEGLAIGSTFDMPLVKSVYAAAAQEARSVGIHVLSTLVLELDRDPRMGRNEEAYTEDPYLYSRIAENIVQGAQGEDIDAQDTVVAGLRHRRPGQRRCANDRFSNAERTHERPRARRHRALRAFAAREFSAPLASRNHEIWSARRNGRISRGRRRAEPRFRKVDERCPSRRTRLQGHRCQ